MVHCNASRLQMSAMTLNVTDGLATAVTERARMTWSLPDSICEKERIMPAIVCRFQFFLPSVVLHSLECHPEQGAAHPLTGQPKRQVSHQLIRRGGLRWAKSVSAEFGSLLTFICRNLSYSFQRLFRSGGCEDESPRRFSGRSCK